MAIAHIASALRPGGHLYLSVPFGVTSRITWQTIYDSQSLAELLRGWSVEEMQVFILDRWRWRPTELDKLGDFVTRYHEKELSPAVALVSATKVRE